MDMEFMRYLFSSGSSGICMGIGLILSVIGCGICTIGAIWYIFSRSRTIFFWGGGIMFIGIILVVFFGG
jgi:hypothetical protein